MFFSNLLNRQLRYLHHSSNYTAVMEHIWDSMEMKKSEHKKCVCKGAEIQYTTLPEGETECGREQTIDDELMDHGEESNHRMQECENREQYVTHVLEQREQRERLSEQANEQPRYRMKGLECNMEVQDITCITRTAESMDKECILLMMAPIP